MTIRELFAKPIDRKIEEVIKVEQHNEETVLNELKEYIVTHSIKEHFIHIFDEIIEGHLSPREGIGIWVSGFFGSGKSSFAKILGYTTAAIPVYQKPASEIFKEHVKDEKISGRLDVITRSIPMDAVIFDLSMDRGVRTASERITEIMYKALLRKLDYAEDFDLAELEITLEQDGLLETFVNRFEEIHGKSWKTRRKLGLAINEASVVLHQLDPKTYPQADSYARSIGTGRADITANKLAERAFELAERRRPGKALIFIIDEVGQYVSRSVEKMLDLQGLVQAFGMEGKNRVQQRKAVSPFWIVVTSQEKLNEIVDALDSKRIELARLQDRFRITIDIKQSDIPEITGERILKKNPIGYQKLSELFEANQGRLNTFCKLERTSRKTSIDKDEFIRLYPYLPYQIDLCIDIVAGLRLKRGAYRHIGGSNRTIIKQAQEMMINPRTMLADAPIGTLVTLDKVYELLYLGNLLPTETTREVDEVPKLLPGNDMALKVAKAIALLETVKDLPKTVHNLAVVLHPSVTSDSVKSEVENAIKALEKAQVIRDSEEGYKLLTVQEKNWDTKRRGLEPKPADRKRLLKEIVKEIFSDPKIRTYRYKNLKLFKLSLSVEGDIVDAEGQVPLQILIAEEPENLDVRINEGREASIEKTGEIYWIITIGEDIHENITELFRSSEMIGEYERLAAQGKLTPEEISCLVEEKNRRERYQRELRTALSQALQSGSGFFRGVQRDGSSLGQSISEVFGQLMDWTIPALYPKLEMGVRHLKGDEAEKFLTAANLNALPPVFYDGNQGLNLVTKEGAKFVPNLSAEICKEVLAYLVREHKYGNKITGKTLETHFQGPGYGWDLDVIQLVMAVLLRGGAVEVTYQGRRYSNYLDHSARLPFTTKPAFRSASFAPREPLDLRTLAEAARQYEEITGKEVDVEEGAIAQAFKKLAAEDREQLLPLVARMHALKLPGLEFMETYLQNVEGILEMPADTCVKTLAAEGKSYREARCRSGRLAEATSEKNLEIIKNARELQIMFTRSPGLLDKLQTDGNIKLKFQELVDILNSETFYESLEALRLASAYITKAYGDLYRETHVRRAEVYGQALESVKGMPEWAAISADPSISETERQAVLLPLTQRAEHDLDFPEGAETCGACGATISQMETDISVVEAIKDGVVKRVLELFAPEEKIERVRVSTLFSGKLETLNDVNTVIEQLRDYLEKLVSQGVKVLLE
ncbi:MAG: BREX system P-loop protein BrxC [Desulfobaccales bacterium]